MPCVDPSHFRLRAVVLRWLSSCGDVDRLGSCVFLFFAEKKDGTSPTGLEALPFCKSSDSCTLRGLTCSLRARMAALGFFCGRSQLSVLVEGLILSACAMPSAHFLGTVKNQHHAMVTCLCERLCLASCGRDRGGFVSRFSRRVFNQCLIDSQGTEQKTLYSSVRAEAL
jgi:hypothetical protein